MKSKYLNTYSLRCKFKEVNKALSVEVTIMNHDSGETVQYYLPISFDGKVTKCTECTQSYESEQENNEEKEVKSND